MQLSINRMAYPITTLGPGRRIGLWVQGCTLRCEGCVSVDTWDENAGSIVDACELAEWLADLTSDCQLDGLTITGGEPLQQADALAELVLAFRRRCRSHVGIILFTGFEESDVRKRFGSCADMVDAFVCGPYVPSLAADDGLVASSNQTILTPTSLGKSRLANYIAKTSRRMQGVVQDNEMSLIGIPRSGDLTAIEGKLLERGIEIGGCSWERR